MIIKVVKEVFSKEELDSINNIINEELKTREFVVKDLQVPDLSPEKKAIIFEKTGRLDLEMIKFPQDIINKVTDIANKNNHGETLRLIPIGCFYAEYSGAHGTPYLSPHYDGGDCNFMFDYQLESNTVWPIGVDEKAYAIKDNEALIFEPLSFMHWRPNRKFENHEFVKMIFFRFFKDSKPKYESPKLSQEKIDRIFNMSQNFYSGGSDV